MWQVLRHGKIILDVSIDALFCVKELGGGFEPLAKSESVNGFRC